MELSTSSISNTISKGNINEDFSIQRAYLEDEASQIVDGREEVAISNEQIVNGDDILDTYEVVSDAVSGGMGSVWRVHHKNWDVDLAMKRPQPRFFAEGGSKRKEAFIAECENWINLGLHPNIVSCYYVREIGGVPSIFSEWMDGGSLKDRIRDGSLYEGTEKEVQERILDIAIQTARGLAYSHDKDLIHQDVKPGNILLTKKWEAKLADFGLAKAGSQLTDSSDKAASSGYTREYCPAEQAAGKAPAKWMDYYAWALTVLEMYMGKRIWNTGADALNCIEKCFDKSRVIIPEDLKLLLLKYLRVGKHNHADNLASPEDILQQIYSKAAGCEYGRPQADNEEIAADNLNNYAMSMLDLGQRDAARAAWNEAVQKYPNHMDSVINRAFFLWRSAELTDKEVDFIINSFPESEERRRFQEKYYLETGAQLLTEDGIQRNGVLPFQKSQRPIVFENNDRIWAADRYGILSCYSLSSDKIVEKMRSGYSHDLDFIIFSEDGRFLYTGDSAPSCHIIRIDRENNNKPEFFDITPSGEEYLSEYRLAKTKRTQNVDQFELQRIENWDSVWLEENETVLCVIERSLWANKREKEQLRIWENSHGNWKTRPPVTIEQRYYFLKFRLSSSLTAKLVFIERLEEGDRIYKDRLHAHCEKWETETLQHPDKSYLEKNEYDVLKDAVNGRIVKSSARGWKILSFSPNQKMYLTRAGSAVYLSCTPEKTSESTLYTLSRIKDIQTLQKEEDQSKKIYDCFCKAFDSAQYPEAIRRFCEYRELSEMQNPEKIYEMELKLSEKCRRTGLYNYGKPLTNVTGFNMSVFNPFKTEFYSFDESEYKESNFAKWAGYVLQECNSPHDNGPVYEILSENNRLLNSKMPIKYRSISGKTIKIRGDINTKYIDLKKAHCYSWVSDVKSEKVKDKKKIRYYLVDADVKTGGINVLDELIRDMYYLLSDKKKDSYYPLMSPDGKKWVFISYGEKKFSPDAGFILETEERYMSKRDKLYKAIPDETSKELKEECIATFPSVPKEYETKEVFFSTDGLHLLFVSDGADPIPWLRLSWDYEAVPEPEVVKKEKDPAADQDKQKGFFARFFEKY